jgi:hypothetical protein
MPTKTEKPKPDELYVCFHAKRQSLWAFAARPT